MAVEGARAVCQSSKEVVPAPGARSVPLSGRVGAAEKRVFVGTVTKVVGRFGFVDEEIIFHETSVKGCKVPPVGSKVLIEATFNPTCATFKWNVQRVQVVTSGSPSDGFDKDQGDIDAGRSVGRKSRSPIGERRRSRSRSRSRSPVRRRPRSLPKYSFCLPKVALQETQLSVMDVKRRYPNLYVPSDFFFARIRWPESLPLSSPLNIYHDGPFHILPKGTTKNLRNSDLYPPDGTFKFSAKVMLLKSARIQDFLKLSCSLDDGSDLKEPKLHPSRVMEFLVGVKQNRWNQKAALGGPWSEALDGPNPDRDPEVLVRTAIRTVRALAGIDLSRCTRWYRILDVHYCRGSPDNGDGKPETELVAIFLPDVWNCLTSVEKWDEVVKSLCLELPSTSPRREDLVEKSQNGRDPDAGGKGEVSDQKDEETSPECPLRLLERQKLPSHPHILASPSTTAKNGKYDCTILTLSKLLDYRPDDKKEKAFEVGLFAELFQEMLLRDFGFLIYNAFVGMPERSERKEKKEKPSGDLEDPEIRRPPKSKYRDQESRIKVADPALLLAFTYFDVNNCGFIAEKDLEDLFLFLGFHLSRSQVRKLVQKVATNGVINYKRLVLKLTEDPSLVSSSSSNPGIELSQGNKNLILDDISPVHGDSVTDKHSLVTWRNTVVDVPNMLSSYEASEKAIGERDVRIAELEEQLSDSKKTISELRLAEAEKQKAIEETRVQLTTSSQSLNEVSIELAKHRTAAEKMEEILRELRSESSSINPEAEIVCLES